MPRLAVALAAVLALLSIGANEASALTAKTRVCISQKRLEYRNALKTLRSTELATFQAKYRACFGPSGSQCAQLCQDGQLACQTGPRGASQKCIEDNDPITGQDDANFTSCGDTFDAAVIECNKLTDDTQALECAKNARLARFACTQACAAAQQPALDGCNFTFNDCVQACA